MSASVESERAAVAETEVQIRTLQQRLDCLQKVEKDVKKNLALMDELENEMGRVKSAKHELKETNLNIERNQEQLRELTNS
eukprot:SAG31_NODE_21858_length_539_cov_0.804545_1_plen_80_part_01